ncbi:DUF4396 domain-containing protein [Micromonospora sp. MS34]|uniref:DUF4396 domain-containing protein n=1 Tax=Micromonospora sp. MS34 TaxID=3385971 RepID=UPI0039A06D58
MFGLWHCLAHCTLGAIIATVIVAGVGIDVAGETLRPLYIGDFLGALTVGVAFRYAAGAHIGGRKVWAAIRSVAREDLLTVSVVELSLFIWIGLVEHLFFSEALRPTNPAFWLIHQVGLIIGYFAAWPATSWLVQRGIRGETPGMPTRAPATS